MTAYHDLDSPQEMRSDAAAARSLLPALLPASVGHTDGFTDLYAGFPSDRPKREIAIDEATQRLAGAIFTD